MYVEFSIQPGVDTVVTFILLHRFGICINNRKRLATFYALDKTTLVRYASIRFWFG